MAGDGLLPANSKQTYDIEASTASVLPLIGQHLRPLGSGEITATLGLDVDAASVDVPPAQLPEASR